MGGDLGLFMGVLERSQKTFNMKRLQKLNCCFNLYGVQSFFWISFDRLNFLIFKLYKNLTVHKYDLCRNVLVGG